MTFLEIAIENNVTFDKQISNICLKGNRKLSTLAKVAKFFPFKKTIFL